LKVCIHNAYMDSVNKKKYEYVSGAQEGYGELFQSLDEIGIIYIKQSFLETTPWELTFRELKALNKVTLDTIRNATLGYRPSIADQLNSLNYLDPEFKRVVIPPLLKKLGDKVLS